jgi:hypothetical protein
MKDEAGRNLHLSSFIPSFWASLLQITTSRGWGRRGDKNMDKEQLLELNDEQVEQIAAADDPGDGLPRCTMTLRWPPEEPVCEPWP